MLEYYVIGLSAKYILCCLSSHDLLKLTMSMMKVTVKDFI